MRLYRNLALFSVLCLGAAMAQAQETGGTEKLNQQLQQLRESLEMQQQQMREHFERMILEQQKQIEALRAELQASRTNPAASTYAAPPIAGSPQLAIGSSMKDTTPAAELEMEKPWSPSQPIQVGTERNYLNLSLSALAAAGSSTARDIENLQLGGHDPRQRGFTLQNLETVLEGKVDPYFRGQANLIFQIDPEGESLLEVEEAYLETMSLPLNLQVKAGQFFTDFGRHNPQHPHAWDFVDQPLVNGRFLGGDGLRSLGARISWLAPTPFYSELFLTVANSHGETAHSFRNEHEGEPFFGRPMIDRGIRNFSDLLIVPRYAASFDLSDSQTLLAGASAAFGPNSSGGDTDTQIYGVDLFWKWRSPHQHGGFPFVTWQTEAMARRFEAGAYPGDEDFPALGRETLTDFGVYSQVSYGFRKGWVAALRGDYVFPDKEGAYEDTVGIDLDRATRWRISPNLTYYPSEFSKIRLQYNYDDRDHIGQDHSIWLQVEFLLGSHAAHSF